MTKLTKRQEHTVRVIRAYLEASGWTQSEFAMRCGMKKQILSHYLTGRRDMSAHAALLIQQGTTAARASGLTKTKPITALDLLPEFAAAKAS